MGKKLSQMTTEDVRKEMSIAGSPDKIISIMSGVLTTIWQNVDTTNAAELTNLEFAMRRVTVEVQQARKRLGKRTGQKL